MGGGGKSFTKTKNWNTETGSSIKSCCIAGRVNSNGRKSKINAGTEKLSWDFTETDSLWQLLQSVQHGVGSTLRLIDLKVEPQ